MSRIEHYPNVTATIDDILKTIAELSNLCNFAISISTNNLMINWINFLKSQSINKSILETYSLMISKLQQKYVSEFSDPASIANKTWGIGSDQQFLPMPDIHEIYYLQIRTEIETFFINRICVLSTDKYYQTVSTQMLNNLTTYFTIPRNIMYDLQSKKSTFHNIIGKYSTWLNERYKTQEIMNIEFDKLRKLVDQYS